MANSIPVWRILMRLGNSWDVDQADFRTLDYPGKLIKKKVLGLSAHRGLPGGNVISIR